MQYAMRVHVTALSSVATACQPDQIYKYIHMIIVKRPWQTTNKVTITTDRQQLRNCHLAQTPPFTVTEVASIPRQQKRADESPTAGKRACVY